jgi:hypothetical protein
MASTPPHNLFLYHFRPDLHHAAALDREFGRIDHVALSGQRQLLVTPRPNALLCARQTALWLPFATT